MAAGKWKYPILLTPIRINSQWQALFKKIHQNELNIRLLDSKQEKSMHQTKVRGGFIEMKECVR